MVSIANPPLPGLRRRLACLAYEMLLVSAIVITLAAVYTPINMWIGTSYGLTLLFRLLLISTLFIYFGMSWVKKGQTVAMVA